ncbi:hypothetical protein HYDPIDRAFT_177691 [Hydnomerulius pinastri MD-312]|uniref:DUF7704 domain-containing protein n=1 Tax=Hydnomerulius pinastri MD-312 TaxID=994086 RepID=A0A0C9W1M5_9AGAM|nr:hypothetical protein HYDPIDRAFT_177691 [Hydnomerulius pinastri MD-312]
MPRDFPALPGLYQALFLYFEPVSTISPAFLAWFFPGAAWFHHELIPIGTSSGPLDARTTMAIWQLGNCYMLLGLISSFVFRAIRDALPNNPEAQERILGASMTALALADTNSVTASWIGLPDELRYSFGAWNPMTHGNITFTVFLCCMRLAWFAGIGRTRYYYGRASSKSQKVV